MTSDTRYSALLIGNSLYPDDPHNLPELRGPVNDLPLLRDALTDRDVGLFDPQQVRVLPERSKREIATAMEEFFQHATRESLVLLYYTGHGRRDEYDNLYLCARDTRSDLLMSTGISDAEISGMMRSCPARTFVVMLDCCYSGSFKGGGLPSNLRGAGRFLITSSRHGQLSADSEALSGASAFTEHLVEALKCGTLDPNGDGYVSLNDVYDFVLTRLQEDTRQIPERHFDHTVGDVAMARSRGAPVAQPVAEPAARAELAVSETNIEIGSVQPGERLPPEIVDVFSRGGGTLDWIAESDAAWIRVEPNPGFVRLWLEPGPGSSRANVRIRDRTSGDTRTIRVHVQVLEEERRPRLQLSTGELDFGELRTGVESPSRSVQLINLGGGALDATIAATDPRIAARLLGDAVEVTIDTATAGDVDGAIAVTSAGGTEHVRVTARVRAGPVLDVGLTKLDFGRVAVGHRPVGLIPVRNAGDGELTWDFGHSGHVGTVERRPDGLAVRIAPGAPGRLRGTVWLRSDGGEAVVDVRADVVGQRAGQGILLAGVVAVAGVAVIALGALAVAVLARLGPFAGTGASITGGAVTAPGSLPDVYGRSESEGGQALLAAGHPTRSIRVCSTLPGGTVRQVMTDAGAQDGVIVDDSDGVTAAGAALTGDAALVMKISTGVPCGGGGGGGGSGGGTGGGGSTTRPTTVPTHPPPSVTTKPPTPTSRPATP